jgi:hypothetical protein
VCVSGREDVREHYGMQFKYKKVESIIEPLMRGLQFTTKK